MKRREGGRHSCKFHLTGGSLRKIGSKKTWGKEGVKKKKYVANNAVREWKGGGRRNALLAGDRIWLQGKEKLKMKGEKENAISD